jgi:hypothetical protein
MFSRIPFDRVNWLVSSFLIGTLFLSVTAVPLYLWFFGCQVCAAAGWHNAERGSGKATSPRHGYPATLSQLDRHAAVMVNFSVVHCPDFLGEELVRIVVGK